MSPRQLARMGGVLVAALLLWGVLAITRRAPADAAKPMALPKIDTATVDTVLLAQHGETVHLTRAARGPWRVNGHPAASDAVEALLRALADTTAWSEQVAVSPASHERFGVAADSGERVQVSSHGRTVLDLIAGKRTGDYGGVYVRRSGDDPVYAVHGGLADGLTRPIGDWRDKHIASVAADSVATIAIQRGGHNYTVQRERQGWRFGSGSTADSAAVASLLNQYRDLTAMGFATTAQADSAHFGRGDRHARLLRANGSSLLSLGFDSTAAHVWVRADSGGPVFQIAAWTLAQLAPADSTLRVKARRGK
jgi:uncharacterized protein DUF4340